MDIDKVKSYLESYEKFECNTKQLSRNINGIIKSKFIKILPVYTSSQVQNILIFSGFSTGPSILTGAITGYDINENKITINCSHQTIELFGL